MSTLFHKANITVSLVTDFISWAPKLLWTVTAATKLKHACSMEAKV